MNRAAFDFTNNISPYYIEPLFMQLHSAQWYKTDELRKVLKNSGLEIDGTKIIQYNNTVWNLIGVVHKKQELIGRSRRNLVRLTSLGQQLQETYSTNRDLFFDIFHFLLYSAWPRSQNLRHARFWLYTQVSDSTWYEAPSAINNANLANRLQDDAKKVFPEFNPSFSPRSVSAVYTWLASLRPPFLESESVRTQYYSMRRIHCTPQLFHLALDLIYTKEHLEYGTSIGISEKTIEDTCKVCLLDKNQFWPMADLTAMMVREFEIKRNQWGRSIVLASAPTWIDLPDYSSQPEETDEEDFDVVAEDEVDDDEGELWI